MIISLTCQYCNHSWERYIASKAELDKDFFCLKCHDSNIEVRQSKTSKIDYYKGCPAFPSSTQTADLLDFMLTGPSEYIST